MCSQRAETEHCPQSSSSDVYCLNTAKPQSFHYDHTSDCSTYFLDDLKHVLPGLQLYLCRHKRQYRCRGEFNGDVTPWFYHRNPLTVQKRVCLYFLEIYGPTPGVNYQGLPTILDKLSFGVVPSSVGLHIAETVCAYAFILYRANNVDRAFICSIMYKHFRSDKDLPFAQWSDDMWSQCTKMMTDYFMNAVADLDGTVGVPEDSEADYQAQPFDSALETASNVTSTVKGILLSKMVHIIVFLTATIGYISGGVPLTNIPVMLERLPLHVSSLQSLSVVEQVLKSIDWLKTVGIDLVTGKYKTWSDLFPNIDVTAWSELVQKRVRVYPAIKSCLARGAIDDIVEGDIVGDLYSNMRLTDDLVRSGESHLRAINMTQFAHGKKIIGERLSDLRAMYNEMLSEQRSQASREAPFSLLICGKSSIGKTNIIEFIKHWHCSIKGLPEGDEYTYTLNPTSKYWDGFRAYKHTLILDDIGSARVPAEDKAIEAVIRCVNNVPFVPDQAALENKGQHPFLCKLVIATANNKGFYAHHRTNNPEALHRRLKFVINVVLKPEYGDLGTLVVPPDMTISEEISLWDFQVQVATVGTDSSGNSTTKYVTLHEFDGDDALLKLRDWYTTALSNHDNNQRKFMQSSQALKVRQFCKVHSCWDCTQEHPVVDKGNNEAPAVPAVSWFSSWGPKKLGLSLTPMLDAKNFKAKVAVVNKQGQDWISGLLKRIRLNENKKQMGSLRNFVAMEPYKQPLLPALSEIQEEQGDVREDGSAPVQHQCYTYVTPAIVSIIASYALFRILLRVRNWLIEQLTVPYVVIMSLIDSATDFIHIIFCQLWWIHTTRRRIMLARDAIKRINYKRVCGAICIVTGAILMCSTFSKLLPANFQMDSEVPNATGNEPPRNVWVGGRTYNMLTQESKTLCGSSFGGRLNTLKKNVVTLYFQSMGAHNVGQSTRATGFLCGQYVLTAAHSVSHVEQTMIIKIVLPKCEYRLTQSEIILHAAQKGEAWFIDKAHDLLVIKMTSSIGYDVTPYLFEDKRHNALPERAYILCVKEDTPTIAPFDVMAFGTENAHSPILRSFLKTASHLGNCFSYQSHVYPLAAGDSGSVVIGQFTNGLAIIGFHVAGNTGVPYHGLCAVLDKNIVSTAMSSLRPVVFQQYGIEEVVVDCGDPTFVDKDGHLCQYGPMDKRCPYFPIPDVEPLLQRNTQYIGRDMTAFTPKSKTQVQDTPYRETFLPLVHELGITDLKVAPKFDYRPKRYFLDKLGNMRNYDVHSYFKQSFEALCAHIIPKLKHREPHLDRILKPLDMHATLNGIPQVQYIDSMNMSTSAGRPYNVIKRSVLEYDGVAYKLKRRQMDDHLRYLSMLTRGERTNLPFKASLKDEPLSQEKNLPTGKGPRLFMCSNLDLTILIRMFFLPYARVAQRNPFLFMSAPGMNAESSQWYRLYNFLTKFGWDNIMAGDYKGFDISMMTIVTYYAFLFKMAILFSAGQYTLEHRRICYALMFDIINPNCDIDGDHFILYGSNPSGHPLTVHTNCLANIFYVMYTWQRSGGELGDFFHKVALMTYGDDNIMGIFETQILNYSTMANCMLEIGVVYTKADKSSISDARLDRISDTEFLKRRFIIRDYDGRSYCFAPLCIGSLAKTLTIWVRSKNITLSEQARDSLSAVWRSTLSHSGNYAESIRTLISSVVDTADVKLFPSLVAFMAQYDIDSIAIDKFAASINWNLFVFDADCHHDVANFNLLRFTELVVLAPLFEETLKRIDKRLAYLFIVAEAYSYCSGADWLLFVVFLRFIVGFFHLFLMTLDFKTACLVHAMYNFIFGGGILNLLAWDVLRNLNLDHKCYTNSTTCPWECRGLGIYSRC